MGLHHIPSVCPGPRYPHACSHLQGFIVNGGGGNGGDSSRVMWRTGGGKGQQGKDGVEPLEGLVGEETSL